MSSKLYEMLGQLPSRVPYARRYRVDHRVLGKIVEFRVLPRSATPEQQALYRAELEELLALDHPCFPPVLECGNVRQRQAYVIPYREHKTIPERIAEQSFYPPQAYAAVASLAGGIAALHDRGFTAGPIEPKMVCWDDRAASAYFLQRRHRVPKFLASDEHVLPEDVRRFREPSAAADVFHWGYFAYFLLSRGKYPYQAEGELTPLARWAPEVPRYLQVAVEAASSWRPEDRPADGAALQTVLLVGGGGGLAGSTGPRSSSGASAEAAATKGSADDQQASQVFQAMLDEVDELHVSLGPRAGQAMPAVSVAEAEAADPEPSTDTEPEMDAYQSGSGLAAVMVPEGDGEPKPEAPGEDLDSTDAAGEFEKDLVGIQTGVGLAGGGAIRSSAVPSGPPLAPVVAVVFLLGAGSGWLGHALLGPEPPQPSPPPVRVPSPRPAPPTRVAPPPTKAPAPAPVPSPSPAASRPAATEPAPSPTPEATAPPPTPSRPVATGAGTVERLGHDEAAPFLEDSGVAQLLDITAVSREQAAEVWKKIRSLTLQGRLPREISDTQRLAALRETLESRPEEGLEQLDAFLAELRVLLGRRTPGG